MQPISLKASAKASFLLDSSEISTSSDDERFYDSEVQDVFDHSVMDPSQLAEAEINDREGSMGAEDHEGYEGIAQGL